MPEVLEMQTKPMGESGRGAVSATNQEVSFVIVVLVVVVVALATVVLVVIAIEG